MLRERVATQFEVIRIIFWRIVHVVMSDGRYLARLATRGNGASSRPAGHLYAPPTSFLHRAQCVFGSSVYPKPEGAGTKPCKF